jgi:tRNA threonylcarbamoyladenosine biosynthesis protein TsaB
MTVLAIRTDSSTTYLAILVNGSVLSEISWDSGRQLARDLLAKISELCQESSTPLKTINGVVCFLGPGSFTGLRIGITVGNTIAYSSSIPIVGTNSEEWLSEGIRRLSDGEDQKILVPEYGAEANITL